MICIYWNVHVLRYYVRLEVIYIYIYIGDQGNFVFFKIRTMRADN